MKLYQHNYKGKWFVLADEPDDEYSPEVTESSEINLDNHADNCLYYGIPMYTGTDVEFRKRCDEALERAIERDEKNV